MKIIGHSDNKYKKAHIDDEPLKICSKKEGLLESLMNIIKVLSYVPQDNRISCPFYGGNVVQEWNMYKKKHVENPEETNETDCRKIMTHLGQWI